MKEVYGEDQERFYFEKSILYFRDLINRAKYWINEYNHFLMRPLEWLSPNEKLQEYNRLQLSNN